MTDKINDGGSAFPGERLKSVAGYQTDQREPVAGMTLRDYFAAKAMQGLAADSERSFFTRDYMVSDAEYCYLIADAMLRARKVTP